MGVILVRFAKILHYCLFKESMICVLVLLQQINSGWSSSPIIGSDQFLVFELFVSLLPVLVIGIFEKDCNEEECKHKNELQLINRFDQLMEIPRLVYYVVFGSIQGILIYFVCSWAFVGVINNQGYTEDSEIRNSLIFLIISLSLLVKILLTTRHFYLPTIISPILSLFFILILVFYFSDNSESEQISRIISNQGLFWILGFTVPLFVTFEYLFFNLVQKRIFTSKFKNRKDMYLNKFESLYKDSDDWKCNEKDETLEINKKSLEFISQFQEKQYQDQIADDWEVSLKIIMSLVCSIIVIYLILIYASVIDYVKYYNYVPITLGFALLFTIFSFTLIIPRNKLFFVYCIYLIIILTIYVSININYSASYFPCVQILFSVFIIFKWRSTVIEIIISYFATLYSIIYQSFFIDSRDTTVLSLSCFILSTGISVLCLVLSYFIDLNKREEFLSIQKAENQFNKSNQILSYLLPNFVKNRVNDGIRYIAEDKGVVSVIFCDICDFDKIVETYEDQEIISLLDGLFSRLDSKCDDIGVTKIETVGKTYLACAGLKDFDSDLVSDINEISHARRAIEFAFEVLSECQKTFMKNGETLKMKIGIHSGPVIAGVVGYHKPQFSLVGDTVNTASRMATTLNSGNMIQISMKTYNLIDDIAGLHFKNNYPEVKGKGAMHTLIVEHFSIKDSGITDYDDSIENSSSNQRDSILSEKFSKYANISKYSSTVFIRS